MGKVVFLLGRNIGKSLSPVLQNAAFAASGLSRRYSLLETGPGMLASHCQKAWRGWACCSFRALNLFHLWTGAAPPLAAMAKAVGIKTTDP